MNSLVRCFFFKKSNQIKNRGENILLIFGTLEEIQLTLRWSLHASRPICQFHLWFVPTILETHLESEIIKDTLHHLHLHNQRDHIIWNDSFPQICYCGNGCIYDLAHARSLAVAHIQMTEHIHGISIWPNST